MSCSAKNQNIYVGCQDFSVVKTIFTKSYMQQFYEDILSKQCVEKFEDYFTKNCRIQINGKIFDASSFKQRMRWLKAHTKSIKVEVVNFFVSQDGTQITDAHISYSIDKKGIYRKVFVIQQSVLENGKIKFFTDATYMIEGGDKDLAIATAK